MTPWYEWVFSGAGVIALGAVGRFVYQRYFGEAVSKGRPITLSAGKDASAIVESPGSLNVAAPVTDSPIALGSNISQIVEVHHHHAENGHPQQWTPTVPTPDQIIEEIRRALPFDQDHTRQNYKGLKVVWETSVRAVKAYPPQWYIITEFLPGSTSNRFVSFFLSSVSAELKSATKGSVVLVKGVVESVGANDIGLEPDPEIRIVKRT